MAEDWRQGGFGIYIHWPYCEAKCPYCDFNSHVTRAIDHDAWTEAYLLEVDRLAAETGGRVLTSIFFGGGTPSLMEPATVSATIEHIRKHWPSANDLEITLEANPSSVEAGRFADFRSAGVNRISMGVQALDDRDLKRLGRLHTVAEARAAYDIARSAFDRVSFDLIYARQDQALADWRAELQEALSMAVDHLSLYQLTIEAGTAFGERYAAGKLRGMPDEDRSADMFNLTQEMCAAHGMPAYEISNHARDGAASRHNLVYWRYGDYLGIGPGAHGRLSLASTRYATECWSNPQKWLDAVRRGSGEKPRQMLSHEDQMAEFLLMGLRLREGVDLDRYGELSDQAFDRKRLQSLEDQQMIQITGSRLSVANQYVILTNAIIRALLDA